MYSSHDVVHWVFGVKSVHCFDYWNFVVERCAFLIDPHPHIWSILNTFIRWNLRNFFKYFHQVLFIPLVFLLSPHHNFWIVFKLQKPIVRRQSLAVLHLRPIWHHWIISDRLPGWLFQKHSYWLLTFLFRCYQRIQFIVGHRVDSLGILSSSV